MASAATPEELGAKPARSTIQAGALPGGFQVGLNPEAFFGERKPRLNGPGVHAVLSQERVECGARVLALLGGLGEGLLEQEGDPGFR